MTPATYGRGGAQPTLVPSRFNTHYFGETHESFADGTRDRDSDDDSGGAVGRSTEIRAAGSSSRGTRRARDARTGVVRPAEDALWPLGSTLGERQDDRGHFPAVRLRFGDPRRGMGRWRAGHLNRVLRGRHGAPGGPLLRLRESAPLCRP